MDSGERVPPEIAMKILEKAGPGTKFNAAFACRKWLSMLRGDLPQISEMNLVLDHQACDGIIFLKNPNEATVAMCQCSQHVGRQEVFLNELMSTFGDRIVSMSIDDCLANFTGPEETFRDSSFSSLLMRLNTDSLMEVHFCTVDFSSTRVWTLSLLSKCSSFRLITFDECKYPSDLNESFFIRIVAPSFANLAQLNITQTQLVTDKFCMSLAKKCSKLESLNLRGCPRITAFSAVAFCESLALSEYSLPLTMDLRETSFDKVELYRHLNNPLVRCGLCWKPQSVVVNIGFDREAIIIGNIQKNYLMITIYI